GLQPRALDQGDDEFEVRRDVLLAHPLLHLQDDGLLAHLQHDRQPLAITAVEQQKGVARLAAHHRGQVVALFRAQREPGAGGEGLGDVQADHGSACNALPAPASPPRAVDGPRTAVLIWRRCPTSARKRLSPPARPGASLPPPRASPAPDRPVPPPRAAWWR